MPPVTTSCPVLETELAEAYRDLGAEGARVELVTINTDPLALARPAARPADEGAVSTVPGWRFLTGSLAQLGPRVDLVRGFGTGAAQHENRVPPMTFCTFIDRGGGRWRSRATPFADESSSGLVQALPRATEAQWAAASPQKSKSLLGLGT